MNTLLILTCALIGLGLLLVVLDALPWGTETYTISTRDLPNTATDLAAAPDNDNNSDTHTRLETGP